MKVWKAVTVELKVSRSFCRIWHFLSTDPLRLQREWLVLFQPRWTVPTRNFQLDVELLECLFQLLLVSGVVRSNGIVEQDELVVQYLHLLQEKKWIRWWTVNTFEIKAIILLQLWGLEQANNQPCSLPGTSAWRRRRFASSRISRGRSGTAAGRTRSWAWWWHHVVPDSTPPNLYGTRHTQL